MSGPDRERREGGLRDDARLAVRLWHFVRPHQAWLWGSLVLLLLASAAGLAQPWLLRLVLDQHLAPGKLEGLGALVATFVGALVLELVLRSAQGLLLEVAGQNALLDLRRAVFRHLQRLATAFFDRTPTGKLIGRVTTDVEALQELFASGVVTILADLLTLTAIVGILLWMSWQLTLVTLLVVPVLLAVTIFIRRHVRDAYGVMIGRRSRLNASLHEKSSGMSLIQAFRREADMRADFGEDNAGLRDAELRTVLWESVLSTATDLLSSLTSALIVWYGGGLAIEALGLEQAAAELRGAVTVGVLFAFLQYMDRFFGPLNDLSLKYTVMQSALTAASRIFELLDQDQVLPEAAQPVDPGPPRGEIRFEGVTFGYDPAQPVLRELSFRVRPGESVAIVGATGAGKTTILKLLSRLYDVQTGRILLDGVDLREYALHDLRRRVGIVPQDVFLFRGDVLENIRLGHPEVSEEEARAAADQLHLDEVVARLPGGYRELVRERGANLSAGERQLIAFARVLALEPGVLALDEATSNVDTRLEELLQEAVATVMGGRTSLVIAHRLSTIRDVDRILVFAKGRLVEEGSHDELLARRGAYWRLHSMQFSEPA
ncbi:MAG: ABC transporter ATP-binding protein [Planctomycetes bacterium]|nr:ABC transporter ATP-binding protein [Planctomycetota bacterium]